MPKRDIKQIMTEHANQMDKLLGDNQKPRPDVKKVVRDTRPVPKTLKGENPYRVLGMDAAYNDVIVRAVKAMDPRFDATRGPSPTLIGATHKKVVWWVSVVEHRAFQLYRNAKALQRLPDGCPDPNALARAIVQKWYAEWGPQMEEATDLG